MNEVLYNSPYYSGNQFTKLFDNMSESYKLFWFKAVLKHVKNNELQMKFDDLVIDMFASAWYMVTEYKLNLGPSDTLEKTIIYVSNKYKFNNNSKETELIKFFKETDDEVITGAKNILINYVPYRIMSPLLEGVKDKDFSTTNKAMKLINNNQSSIYYFNEDKGLKRRLLINGKWFDYLRENSEILNGWIDYNLISYLQRRNPNVPGIINKLAPPEERKLEDVKKLYKEIIYIKPFIDIYTNNELNINDISIDHFIPWSYVSHDELWNLIPTSKNVNSSKSNNLPNWDKYFNKLVDFEYNVNSFIKYSNNDNLLKMYEKCLNNNLNNNQIKQRLYIDKTNKKEFYEELNKIVFPSYVAARNMNFGIWEYKK